MGAKGIYRCNPVGGRLATPRPGLTPMRAVQITGFGGPEVLDVVDLPDPAPGPGQQLYEVRTARINFAETHQRLS